MRKVVPKERPGQSCKAKGSRHKRGHIRNYQTFIFVTMYNEVARLSPPSFPVKRSMASTTALRIFLSFSVPPFSFFLGQMASTSSRRTSEGAFEDADEKSSRRRVSEVVEEEEESKSDADVIRWH